MLDLQLFEFGQVGEAGRRDPFVALRRSSTRDDFDRWWEADPWDVGADGNICKAVYLDYSDPIQ